MRNSANVISVAVATAVIVFTMGPLGVEASLDAVSPEVAGAFVSGLNRVFWMMGGLLVIGMIIVLARSERRKPPPEVVRGTDSCGTESKLRGQGIESWLAACQRVPAADA